MSSTDKQKAGSAILVILMVAGLLTVILADGGLAVLALGETVTMQTFIVAHLVAAFLLVLLAIIAHSLGIRATAFYILLILIGILGPLGVLATAFVIALSWLFSKRSLPFDSWRAAFFADAAADRVGDLDARLAKSVAPSGNQSTLVAFGDVMALGTVSQKQTVLGLVADHYAPAYAGILRTALNDKDLIIRVHAASIAGRLENGFQALAGTLRQRSQANPADMQTAADLADMHDEYARSGLADDYAAADAREAALRIYTELARRFPQAARFRAAEARLLLETGRSGEVIHRFWPQIEGGGLDPETVRVLLSALTAEKRFAELRLLADVVSRADSSNGLAAALGDLLSPWRRTPAADGAS